MAEDRKTTFEIGEVENPNHLLNITIEVGKGAAPMGQVPVVLLVRLRQNLPMATQLGLIREAMDTLKQMERALVTGDTSGGATTALKA